MPSPSAATRAGALEQLPDELLLHVLRHLDAPSLLRLACTCRRLRALAADDGLWRRLFRLRFGLHAAVGARGPHGPDRWWRHYRAMHGSIVVGRDGPAWSDCDNIGAALARLGARGGRIVVKPGRYVESLVLDRAVALIGGDWCGACCSAAAALHECATRNSRINDSDDCGGGGDDDGDDDDSDGGGGGGHGDDDDDDGGNCNSNIADSGNSGNSGDDDADVPVPAVLIEQAERTVVGCVAGAGGALLRNLSFRLTWAASSSTVGVAVADAVADADAAADADVIAASTTTGGSTATAGAPCVLVADCSPRLLGCHITSACPTDAGLRVSGPAAAPLVRRCRIADCEHAGVSITAAAAGRFEALRIGNNRLAGIAIGDHANPVVRRSVIHDGRDAGVCVLARGRGVLQRNDIRGSRIAGVELRGAGAAPVLVRNRIRDGRTGGVYVHDAACGTFIENDISGNACAGVWIAQHSEPIFRRNRIHGGHQGGIYLFADAGGTIVENDLYDNALAAIQVRGGANPRVIANHIHDGASAAAAGGRAGGALTRIAHEQASTAACTYTTAAAATTRPMSLSAMRSRPSG